MLGENERQLWQSAVEDLSDIDRPVDMTPATIFFEGNLYTPGDVLKALELSLQTGAITLFDFNRGLEFYNRLLESEDAEAEVIELQTRSTVLDDGTSMVTLQIPGSGEL